MTERERDLYYATQFMMHSSYGLSSNENTGTRVFRLLEQKDPDTLRWLKDNADNPYFHTLIERFDSIKDILYAFDNKSSKESLQHKLLTGVMEGANAIQTEANRRLDAQIPDILIQQMIGRGHRGKWCNGITTDFNPKRGDRIEVSDDQSETEIMYFVDYEEANGIFPWLVVEDPSMINDETSMGTNWKYARNPPPEVKYLTAE